MTAATTAAAATTITTTVLVLLVLLHKVNMYTCINFMKTQLLLVFLMFVSVFQMTLVILLKGQV